METFLILLLAAGLSAAVVWWSLAPSGDRRRVPPRISVRGPAPEPEGSEPDGFVLLPLGGPSLPEDRPPRARSVLLLAATITAVATLSVILVALLGLVIKAQLDRYFAGVG